jgi:hypothetical protein
VHTAFLMVAALGSIFFATRRQVDYFVVAFFGCLIYFLPGFFGFVAVSLFEQSTIVPETYAIMTLVMTSTMFFAYLSDLALPRNGVAPPRDGLRTSTDSSRDILFVNAIAAMAAIGLIMTAHEAGADLLKANKHQLMTELSRWHILFYVSTLIGFPAAFMTNRRVLAVIFMGALCFWLYVGFRDALAIAVISALILYLSRHGTSLLRAVSFKTLMITVFAAVVLFVYKEIYILVKLGAWDIVEQHLGDSKFYLIAVVDAEPFGTQALLNAVVANNFHTGLHSITSAISSGLWLFGDNTGDTTGGFNGLIESTFFPVGAGGGLAGNIWAQMWSVGGWLGLVLFIAIYNFVIMIGNLSLRAKSPAVRAGLAPVFVYWAFYIQRNELDYALNLEKRVLLVFAIGILVAGLLSNKAVESSSAKG